MKKEEIIEYSCISCGACVKYCPINNNPKYVMDNPNKRMSKLQQKRCLNCNLCSYICPAFINLHKFMKAGDKNE